MTGFASSLSSQELSAVVDYVMSLGGSGGVTTVGSPTTASTTTTISGTTGTTGTTSTTGTTASSVGAAVKTRLATGGRELYSLHCASCHATDGRGNSIGPSIIGEADELFDSVRYGEGSMPAFPKSVLSNREIRDIVSYVRSLSGGYEDDKRGRDHEPKRNGG